MDNRCYPSVKPRACTPAAGGRVKRPQTTYTAYELTDPSNGRMMATATDEPDSRAAEPSDAHPTATPGATPRLAYLVCSARLNLDLADRYAEVERRIGHRFRNDLTMADVIAEAHDAGQLALIPLADIA